MFSPSEFLKYHLSGFSLCFHIDIACAKRLHLSSSFIFQYLFLKNYTNTKSTPPYKSHSRLRNSTDAEKAFTKKPSVATIRSHSRFSTGLQPIVLIVLPLNSRTMKTKFMSRRSPKSADTWRSPTLGRVRPLSNWCPVPPWPGSTVNFRQTHK